MQNLFLIPFAKLILFTSRRLGLGAGSTWPGHITLSLNPKFLKQFRENFKGPIILIAGTNGKTTTSKMIRTILEAQGKKVIHNMAGANLLNGIASAIVSGPTSARIALFEVDENTLPFAVKELSPSVIVLLNLFRDQLDRYGEVDSIAKIWNDALKNVDKKTIVILNADDPHTAFIGRNLKTQTFYFGIDNKKLFLKTSQHAMDASFCPNCGEKIIFSGIYFSHLGIWECKSCGFSRPETKITGVKSPLPGIYNIYNTQAAMLVAQTLGIDPRFARKRLINFTPAFGRQEEFVVNEKGLPAGRQVKIFLSKNPAGFNESIRTVKSLGGKNILLVLNDKIPDGRDVSWIWDVDFEELISSNINIVISGDRCYDMGLRIKYTSSSRIKNTKFKIQNYNLKFKIIESLREAIKVGLKQVTKNETLYVLPTYSAMLEVRKILTGRKIL